MFQKSTGAGSRPWTLKETQPFQVALTSSPFQVSSVCLSALGVKTRPARQDSLHTCRKGLPLPPCCQTRASSPPLRRQPHVHRRLVLLLPPPARASCRLFSLSLSQLFQLPPPQQPGAASTTLCTPPSTLPTDSHTFTEPIHSFIRTKHLRAGHLTHHIHHNINHTHTRLTRFAHSPPSNITHTHFHFPTSHALIRPLLFEPAALHHHNNT